MTAEEKVIEAEGSEDIILSYIVLHNVVDVTVDIPNYDPKFLLQKTAIDTKTLNISQ